MNIAFEVLGKIQGKQRARVTKFGTHTPKQTIIYENLVKMTFIEKFGGLYQNYEGSVVLEVHAHFKLPKNTSKKKFKELYGKPCLKAPDADNILKSISDGLNGIAYRDDKQIFSMICKKLWSNNEGVLIRIKYLGDN